MDQVSVYVQDQYRVPFYSLFKCVPMYSNTVPSSFSSTICVSKTLSYNVCGGLTAEGMTVDDTQQAISRQSRGNVSTEFWGYTKDLESHLYALNCHVSSEVAR